MFTNFHEHLWLLSQDNENFPCTFCVQQCDDESGKHTTRSPNFGLLGDSERGTVCPNYPNCNGTLLRKVYSLIHLIRTRIFLLLHRTTFDSKLCLIYSTLKQTCTSSCHTFARSQTHNALLKRFLLDNFPLCYHNQLITSLAFKKDADRSLRHNSSRKSNNEDQTCV